tara:strand:+ start:259 stop:690 length:432 start_codon:yes stop_codon:yes gene_type:complete
MKNLFYLLFVLPLLFSCGDASGDASEDKKVNETDLGSPTIIVGTWQCLDIQIPDSSPDEEKAKMKAMASTVVWNITEDSIIWENPDAAINIRGTYKLDGSIMTTELPGLADEVQEVNVLKDTMTVVQNDNGEKVTMIFSKINN